MYRSVRQPAAPNANQIHDTEQKIDPSFSPGTRAPEIKRNKLTTTAAAVPH